MRKDLRLGLGIGALALVFAVTFLVVRNHTQNQLEDTGDGAQASAEGVTAGPPGANMPAATVGGGAPISTVILPPLQPVKPPAETSKITAPAPAAKTPIPTTPVAGRSNWDALLSEGRPPGPISSSAINRTPPPSVTADPFNQVTRIEPPAARPMSPTGQLSAMTGRPYTIRQGDTFSSVAKEQYGAEKYYLQIEQANPNVNTMRLKPGQQIILPELDAIARGARPRGDPIDRASDNRPINERTEYRVDTGDSLYRISMRLYGNPRMADAIYEMNRSAIGANPDRLRLGMILRLPAVPDGK